MASGLGAVAAAAAAAMVVVTQLPGGMTHTAGTVAAQHAGSATTLRAKLLAAFDAARDQILYDKTTVRGSDREGFSSQEWYAPWGARVGQQVRDRQLSRNANGTLSDDSESIGALPMIGTPQPGYKYPTSEDIRVNYRTRTWSDQKGMPTDVGTPWDAATLRAQISAGFWTVTGAGEVNGHKTIELSRHRSGGSDGIVSNDHLWVDAQTYLPLQAEMRWVSSGHKHFGIVHDDFKLLPATPANLAHLKAVIPPGFRRTAKAEK
jgi:hypothetical protein